MIDCEHKNIFVEKIAGRPAIRYGHFIFDKHISFDVPEIKAELVKYCVDCGLRLGSVEIRHD